MAEVNGKWTTGQTRAQFVAISWLRWRMLRNSLRRKGGIGDLVAIIIMLPLFGFVILAICFGAGFGAGVLASKGEFGYISGILWVVFVLCQLASIQLGQPGTTFDPTQLIRFPLNFRGYAAIRTFFGVLSPANVTSTLASLAIAIGVTVAVPGLWLWAFAAMAAFALVNIFFTRMVFSWVDRWLSTRRAREVFTALIFIFGMTVQYLNFTFNLGSKHQSKAVNAARLAQATRYYHHAEPVLAMLPPGLTANSMGAAHSGQMGTAAAEILGVLVFTAVFFAVFAMRLYKEFRGENLSDVANAVAKAPEKRVAAVGAVALPVAASGGMSFHTPDTVSAVFGKEFLTLRRNTGIFYALVAPLVMIVLFANLKAGHVPEYILFPSAVAYALMGVAPLCYNSMGFEAAGIQFYFLAPVKMRDVFIAKNLLNVGLAAAEIVAVFIAITYVARMPSLTTAVSVLLWATFTMLVTMAVGNHRSITAPKKIDVSKMGRNQASPLSALISIGLLLLCAGLGAGVLMLSRAFDMAWLLPVTMLVLAAVGAGIYVWSLGTLDKTLAENRDTLSEVLSKAG
jgi:ABC-2 type transport system permease protein